MGTPQWSHLEKLPEREVVKGVHIRILVGDRLMYSIVRIEPLAVVPTHQHAHEQLSYMLDGELEMWISDDRRVIRRGDMCVIPSDVPHGGQATAAGCLVLDAFHPIREEYVKLFSGA